MAAPGTKTLDRHDSTNKHKVEYWDITTHPAGVRIDSSLGRIVYAQATWSEFIGEEASSLQAVIGTGSKFVTIYNTAGIVKTANVMLVGDP